MRVSRQTVLEKSERRLALLRMVAAAPKMDPAAKGILKRALAKQIVATDYARLLASIQLKD